MAILKEPLFGEEARGQIAKCAIFRRSAVHPQFGGCLYHKQNWTPAHTAQAVAWRTLCLQWQALSDTYKVIWKSEAPGVLTGFNFFMQRAGVLPAPPPYQPPAGDNINFDFVTTPYSPPAGDQINLNIGDWPD